MIHSVWTASGSMASGPEHVLTVDARETVQTLPWTCLRLPDSLNGISYGVSTIENDSKKLNIHWSCGATIVVADKTGWICAESFSGRALALIEGSDQL